MATVRLPGTRRSKAPLGVMAQRREVERRWNTGETAGVIAKALGLSERTIHSTLARLRMEHFALRPHRNTWKTPSPATTPPSPGLAAEFGRTAPSVVTVYDAHGRAVAQIDPLTRKRRALA